MGKEIVYCGDCGQSLREDDFGKGKAQHIDHRPFCTKCRPLTQPPPSQIQTSSKLAAMAKASSSSSGKYAPAAGPAPSTRRHRVEEESSRTPLLIGAGLVVAAILILIVFTMSSTGRTPDVAVAPPPAQHASPPKAAPKSPPPSPAPAPKPDVDKAEAALKELEAIVAATAPPIAILQRCDEIRPVIQGTPYETRFKGIEDRAREARRVQQLDASLDEVKKLRALDPAYERKEEIVRLLNATLALSGPRRPEVEETLRSYQKDAQAYVPPKAEALPRPAPPPPPKPAPAPAPTQIPAAAPAPAPAPAAGQPLGPYETDAAGCVNHWLVLGPFPNRPHRDGLYDQDILAPEAQHVPAAGREAAKLRWTPVVVTEGRVYFRKVLDPAPKPAAPGIAFAACWIDLEQDTEVKFKMSAEAGFFMYLDHQKIRNQPGGHMFGEEEDVIRQKLTKGPHLVLFKIAAQGTPFAVRLKLTKGNGERMPGVKIWNQPPVTRTLLRAENFNDGPGKFENGQIVDGGVDGTKALLIHQKTVTISYLCNKPVTAETTVRFKIKPLYDIKLSAILFWSPEHNQNAWHHLKGLKRDEWNVVEVKIAEVRCGWANNGPDLAGTTPFTFRILIDDKVADARALVDDFELFE